MLLHCTVLYSTVRWGMGDGKVGGEDRGSAASVDGLEERREHRMEKGSGVCSRDEE